MPRSRSLQWCTVSTAIAASKVPSASGRLSALACRHGADPGGRCADHHRRRLDRHDLAAGGLVRARAGADVDDRRGVAERPVDLRLDARVGHAGRAVGRADLVVVRHRRSGLMIPAGSRARRRAARCGMTAAAPTRESELAFEVVTMGETMLRLSPPAYGRLEHTDALDLHVGGAESNVAVALARLGRRAAWVSALPAYAARAPRVRCRGRGRCRRQRRAVHARRPRRPLLRRVRRRAARHRGASTTAPAARARGRSPSIRRCSTAPASRSSRGSRSACRRTPARSPARSPRPPGRAAPRSWST